jgi:hypothetical protein
MKKTILISMLWLTTYAAQAQFTPLSPELFFSSNVPAAPSVNEICTTTKEKRQAYAEKLLKIQKELDEQIAYLKKNEKQDAALMQEQARQKAANDLGLSPADMQKMQSGKMSKEEKKAMADKMMQQQFGITTSEAQDVAGYSKAGKEAWATDFAQSQQGNAKNQQAPQSMSLIELNKEKDALSLKLSTTNETYAEQFRAVENDTAMARLLREIDAHIASYNKLVGVDYGQGPEMEKLILSIKSKKAVYCSKQTTKYLGILERFAASVVKDMPDYYRLEALINEVNKKTTGSDVNMMKKGLLSYENIKLYVSRLAAVYQFSLYDQGNAY